MFRVLVQKLSGALLLAGGYALVQSENNALNIINPFTAAVYTAVVTEHYLKCSNSFPAVFQKLELPFGQQQYFRHKISSITNSRKNYGSQWRMSRSSKLTKLLRI
jgi:hypothetical protein